MTAIFLFHQFEDTHPFILQEILGKLLVLIPCDSMWYCKVTHYFQIVKMKAAWIVSKVIERTKIDYFFQEKSNTIHG